MNRNADSDSSRALGGLAASHISAHADYRHEDYFFSRHQSRTAEVLEWQDDGDAESRGLGPGLLVAVVLLVICGLCFMLWEESEGYAETSLGDTHRPLVERSGGHFDLRSNREYFSLPDTFTIPVGYQDVQPLIARLVR